MDLQEDDWEWDEDRQKPVHIPGEVCSQDAGEQRAGQAGFIEIVLAGLAQCRSLKVLKLVCLHAKVMLTR